jgi:hypothetical protein
VELNRAVAIAEAGDVEAALALVESLELDRYHYLHATHAELLRRLDRVEDPAQPTTARSSSFSRAPSAGSSSGGWLSSKTDGVCRPPEEAACVRPDLDRRSKPSEMRVPEGTRIVCYARTPVRTSTIGAS